MNKINCLIGEIVSGFVRTEFLLSQILSELGLRENNIDFFAESQTKWKLQKILGEIEGSNIKKKKEYCRLIYKFNELREKRNIVVHGLVLTNVSDSNNHMFYNYIAIKNTVYKKIVEFNTSDLELICSEIRDIHNALCNLHFHKE